MKRIVVLFLALLGTVRAFSVFADGVGIDPGFLSQDPVLVTSTGGLSLQKPGTYIAASWSLSGVLRLPAPGNYTVVASSGSIAINAGAVIRGPSNGEGVARITFVAPAGFLMSGTTDGAVTVAQGLPSSPGDPPLINLSTRATLSAGQTLLSGFVLNGTVARRVLIRAIGPTLATFGIANALGTPTITVLNGNNIIGANFGWGGSSSLSAAFSAVGAFPLASSSKDAALILTLAPGAYTFQVGGGAGEVLAEMYLLDVTTSTTQGAGG